MSNKNPCPHCENWKVHRCDSTGCDLVRIGEGFARDQCRNCWLYFHDVQWNLANGGDGKVTHAPRHRKDAAPVSRPKVPPPPPPLGKGPGTELKKLLASLGVNPVPSCDCNAKAEEMDRLGVEGCKKNRAAIAQFLRNNAARLGWKEKLQAALLAIREGIAFQIDFNDIYGSLVDLAIHHAEKATTDERTLVPHPETPQT